MGDSVASSVSQRSQRLVSKGKERERGFRSTAVEAFPVLPCLLHQDAEHWSHFHTYHEVRGGAWPVYTNANEDLRPSDDHPPQTQRTFMMSLNLGLPRNCS